LRILITGSEGLVGKALARTLRDAGIDVVPFDFRVSAKQDLRRSSAVASALAGADGVVHLAAVSRVVWGERNPALCREINERAFAQLVSLCESARPWLIFSSSREVYGQQDRLPVTEAAALKPVNTYARSKVFGEQLVARARTVGMTANVVRLSNVYGSVHDHPDRVMPAFARAAATGGAVRVEGGSNTFDFTHASDVTRGLVRLVELTAEGRLLDPIHLTTGIGTTLAELAELAAASARNPVRLEDHPSRTFDVSSFVGSPARARRVLDWATRVELKQGFVDLVADFAAEETLPVTDFWTGMLENVH
jgi:nucleoside-diphosphate-sugar epimerase